MKSRYCFQLLKKKIMRHDQSSRSDSFNLKKLFFTCPLKPLETIQEKKALMCSAKIKFCNW